MDPGSLTSGCGWWLRVFNLFPAGPKICVGNSLNQWLQNYRILILWDTSLEVLNIHVNFMVWSLIQSLRPFRILIDIYYHFCLFSLQNGFRVFTHPRELTQDQLLQAYYIFSRLPSYEGSMFHHYRRHWAIQFGERDEEVVRLKTDDEVVEIEDQVLEN